MTERGTPFVKEYFGNWFGEVSREAGCPGSAHAFAKPGPFAAAEVHQIVRSILRPSRFDPTVRCRQYVQRESGLSMFESSAGAGENQPILSNG